MKKVIIFILCMVAGTTHAYNPEATQKLQEHINTVMGYGDTAQSTFLKDVKKLINEGANPNIKDSANNTLLDLLVQGPIFKKDVDFVLLEEVFKTALDNGASMIIDPEMPYAFSNAITASPPRMIKMLIQSGKDKKQIEQNTNNALKIIDTAINHYTESLQRAQKEIDKLNRVVNEIKQPTKNNERITPI